MMKDVFKISSQLALWVLRACLSVSLPMFASENGPSATLDGKCPELVSIPGGTFEMGDHHDLGGREHPSDEIPVHAVTVGPFQIGRTEVTTRQYCEFLNGATKLGWIETRNGLVSLPGTRTTLCETRPKVSYSGISHDASRGRFSVVSGREDHPAVGIRWEGAALFCNWLSHTCGYPRFYDTETWDCDLSKDGFRLPTEAEWEYAARGGQHWPYRIFPWGDEPDNRRANWPRSGDPFEYGDYPWTTPVGFYNGQTHSREDFNWPGTQTTYRTADGVNGYGLYDVCGNVWEWVHDWYGRSYYRQSPSANPTGPESGSIMPDRRAYRGMRGGNWYNGQWGHSRVSNRDPGYYRGPQDPDHPYYHVGFRPVLASASAEQASAPRTREFQAEKTVGLLLSKSAACSGYTLMAPKHAGGTYLLDLNGQVVHQWISSRNPPGQSVYLLSGGRLLRTCMVKQRGGGGIGGGEGGRIEMYDWDDNLIWEYDLPGLHHDIAVMENGNILALYTEQRSLAEAQAVGFTSDILRDRVILPDCVLEIKPTMPRGGEIVWRWRVWDHLIQNDDRRKTNYGDPAGNPGRIWTRCNGRGAKAFWNHMNSIDYNADLDQIVLSVRGCSEIWIIDHSTTEDEAASRRGGHYGKGGDLLYRWGNPAAYNVRGIKQLFDQHDARWIPEGYPGEGDILIFNNGLNRPGGEYSSVEQITPPLDSGGGYTLSGSGYGPAKPTWSWKAADPMSYLSSQISGAFRLPNGNTLLCAGVHGELTEVTQAGEIVWKYVNPVTNTGILAQGEKAALDHRGHSYNAVFKIERIALDDKRLAGKILKPSGVLEKLPGQGTADTLGSGPRNEPQRRGPGRNQGRRGFDDRGRGGIGRPRRQQNQPRGGRPERPGQRRNEARDRQGGNRLFQDSFRNRQFDQNTQRQVRGGRAAVQGQQQGGRSKNTADTLNMDVPEFACNVIVGRPAGESVDLSILSQSDASGQIAFWPTGTNDRETRPLNGMRSGEVLEVTLSNLKAGTGYEYVLTCKPSGSGDSQKAIEGSFHTARSDDDEFLFTVQADSHLDSPETAGLYRHVLDSARQDHPDLHIALGDTFMTGNYGERYKEAEARYLVQRDILSTLCSSSALFFVPGNHDGEWGRYLDGTADNLAAWATNMRKQYLPNPYPDDFYSSNSRKEQPIGLPENYCAFEWGCALFVTLDPYRYAGGRGQGRDSWRLTLGKDQYDWLAKTLRSSNALYKFIFVHQLVGGAEGNGRGGVEFAKFQEWGGHEYDGEYTFEQRRPGWEKPIHDLLKETSVSIVFHGHDHFYAHQELDGIVYQLVPQPGRAVPSGTPKQAQEYGYRQGTILPGSGYLRARVSPDQTTVEYVRFILARARDSAGSAQSQIAHTYTIGPR